MFELRIGSGGLSGRMFDLQELRKFEMWVKDSFLYTKLSFKNGAESPNIFRNFVQL